MHQDILDTARVREFARVYAHATLNSRAFMVGNFPRGWKMYTGGPHIHPSRRGDLLRGESVRERKVGKLRPPVRHGSVSVARGETCRTLGMKEGRWREENGK